MSSVALATNRQDKERGSPRVCTECFNDDALRQFVRRQEVPGKCDFCGATKGLSAPWEATRRFILEGIESEFATEAFDGVEWGDGESGPLPRSYLIDEVLERLGSPIKNQSLIAEIGRTEGPWFDLFEDHDGSISRHENWNGFCHRVMYRSRFFFYRPMEGDANEYEPTQWPSVEVLDDVADLIRDARLVKPVSIEQRFFRARQHHPKEPVLTPGQLGPPSSEQSRSSRMSPAGIVMFYGAEDPETALREVANEAGARRGETRLTVGAFAATKEFRVVDLTQSGLPRIPSPFDGEQRSQRSRLGFLKQFAEEIAYPIARDRAEHIEYVPTQVVTEYLRYIFRDQDGEPAKGILYSSSRNKTGTCCALFMESDECGGDLSLRFSPRQPWLRLDKHSVEHFDLAFDVVPRFTLVKVEL
jgi:hypothetical protein